MDQVEILLRCSCSTAFATSYVSQFRKQGIKLFRLVHVELYKLVRDFCLFLAYRYQV